VTNGGSGGDLRPFHRVGFLWHASALAGYTGLVAIPSPTSAGRIALVGLVTALFAGCGPGVVGPGAGPTVLPGPTGSARPSGQSPSAPATPGLVVAGRWLAASGIDTVADALSAAGVSVVSGRLLSVVTARVLDADAFPGRVRVNGVTAALAARVGPGDVVTVAAGRDRVEATETVRVPVTLSATASRLYRSVRPGVGDETRGVVSHERLRLSILTAPTVGRLRTGATAALTVDDGPAPATTAVLAQITAHHIPAVFCLIGAEATGHPALVRAEVAAGAALCDHTQTHPANLPALPASRIAAEIRGGLTSIVTAGGVRPVYFRAPGGHWSATVDRDAAGLGLGHLGWTVDPRDWSRPGSATIETRVLDQLRPGGVILLHDGGGDRSQTVTALRVLLDELIAAGWRFTLPPRVTATRLRATES
jgi:peptidoglycan/xylan/chitin deacetylase (PgdA/CDA1 family)